jgi:hypothetical protein
MPAKVGINAGNGSQPSPGCQERRIILRASRTNRDRR